MTNIVKNLYGFFEINPKPTREELTDYYSKKYYQDPKGQYQNTYSDDEKKFSENKAKIALRTIRKTNASAKSLFEIGCGEGFFANYFYDNNITDIELNDFSDFGLKNFHPHLLEFLKKIDAYQHIEDAITENKKFDIISMDNVLEHVVDPKNLLLRIKNLMHSNSVLRVTVPNDFSSFQKLLLSKDICTPTWVCPPDHLSYFNSSNLNEFCEALGFKIYSSQCDFPIELFLTNEHSHYYNDRSLGKGAHKSRVLCTNYLVDQDIDAYITLSEAAAKLQFGRNISVYLGV